MSTGRRAVKRAQREMIQLFREETFPLGEGKERKKERKERRFTREEKINEVSEDKDLDSI